MGDTTKLQWKIHLPNLLSEITSCSLRDGSGILRVPLNTLRILLQELTSIAIRIDDPELHKVLCKLTLYDIADPEHPDYDPDVFKKLDKLIEEKLGKDYTDDK